MRFIRHSIGKIILRGIAGKICQRQHRDRIDGADLMLRKEAVTQSPDVKSEHQSGHQEQSNYRDRNRLPVTVASGRGFCREGFGGTNFRRHWGRYFLLWRRRIPVLRSDYETIAFSRDRLQKAGLFGIFP